MFSYFKTQARNLCPKPKKKWSRLCCLIRGICSKKRQYSFSNGFYAALIFVILINNFTLSTIAYAEAPVLSTPSGGSTISTVPVTFVWEAIGDAIQYHFQIAADSGFNDIKYSRPLTGTSLDLSFAGDGNSLYWRVRAKNVSGWGEWSQEWSFITIAPLPAPAPIAPADGGTTSTVPVTFIWQSLEGAIQYHFQIAADSGFNDIKYARLLTGTSLDLSFAGDGNSLYWRVRAKNVSGWGEWSQGWSFMTIAPPEKPSFGIHSGFYLPQSTLEVGAEWISMSPQIFWGNVEDPTIQAGAYKYSGHNMLDLNYDFDKIFSYSKSMGIKNGLTLSCFGQGTPRAWTKWQEDTTQFPVDDYPGTIEDGSVDPVLEQAWIDFVKKTVERYDGDSDFGCTLDAPDCYREGDNQYPDFDPSNPPKADFYHIEEEWKSCWWRNEPDETPDNPVAAIRYVNLLKITSQAIKDVDPEAKIIIPGLASGVMRLMAFSDGYIDDLDGGLREGIYYSRNETRDFPLYQLLKAEIEYILREGKEYFDIVDVHLYEEKTTFLEGKVAWLRDKMMEYGYQKPIWSIEAGGPFKLSQEGIDCILDPLCEGPKNGDYSFGPYTDKENAEFVLKLFTLAFGSKIDRFTFPALVFKSLSPPSLHIPSNLSEPLTVSIITLPPTASTFSRLRLLHSELPSPTVNLISAKVES